MSTSVSHTTAETQPEPPHLLSPRNLDVLTSRDISLDLAVQSGLRTRTGHEMTEFGFGGNHARDGLHIPLFNTQGIVSGDQLRPDDPPIKETVRPDGAIKRSVLKYLLCAGAKMQLYVPPASQPFLDNPDIPLVIAESPLKALAILSNAKPGSICVIAIIGVWGWRTKTKHGNGYKKMPLPEHKNGISWGVVDRDGRIRKRRQVYVVFDSDVHTNIMVSRARWEYTEYLDNLGADVWWIDLPTTPEGNKQGVDDALAAGDDNAWAAMLEGAYRAPEVAPELAYTTPNDEQETELEYWQRRCKDAERRAEEANRRASSLVQIIRNPEAKETEKRIMVSALTLAASEASRGKYEPDGRIKLEPRHVANDHRGQPKRGESLPERNPFDDTKPLTRRARVPNILQSAADAGVVTGFEIRHVPTRNDDGTWTKYPEILIDPPQLNEALEKVAAYIPADAKPRQKYTKQERCPHCGERHEWKVVCTGCGGEADTRRNQPGPVLHVVDDGYTEPMVAQHDDGPELLHSKNVRSSEGDAAPVSAPTSIERTKNERAPIGEEIEQRMSPSTSSPESLFDGSGSRANGDDGTCCLCSNPRVGSKYFCSDHLQDSKRRAQEVAS